MMTAMRKIVPIPLRYLFLAGLLAILAISIFCFFQVPNERTSAFFGGVSGGILAVVISFLFSMYEYGEIDRYKALGVQDILSDRRDDSYYKNIVKEAKEKVQVMGTSCTRFIEDFADLNSGEHALIDALDSHKNLEVELLVPTDENMDDQSKLRFEAGKDKLAGFQDKFKDRVQLKRYKFQARHSLVRVDNNLIVGPVFQGVESKHSPAIHVNTTSAFAEKYLEYYQWVWEESLPYPDENSH